jgi:hypothetical protein
MAAEPIEHQPDPLDPAQILADLPEDERDFFWEQYREHSEAVRDPGGWSELHKLLRLWRFHADSTKDPGYWVARRAADAGAGGGMLLEDYVRARRA